MAKKSSNWGLKSIKTEIEEYKESMKERIGLSEINKIDKPLSKMTKRWRDNIQVNKIREKKYNNKQLGNTENHKDIV